MFVSKEYGFTGSIDVFFDVGAPKWLVTELKIMKPEDFEKLAAPLPEHRIRTNLYMKLIADSNDPYKDKINVFEARVLYVSRGYGKKNVDHDQILPFKEFVVKRDDTDLQWVLKLAKQVKVWRETGQIPSGICKNPLDKTAKNCSASKHCFSGSFPAQQEAL